MISASSATHLDMQTKLDTLQIEASKSDLEININKTKLLRLNARCNNLVTDSLNIDDMKEFTSVDSTLT